MPVDEKLRGMDERLYRMRHSCAHVMAEAVLGMFPGAKLAIGPPIDNGFYYDFELPRPLTPEDLEEVEKRMRASMAASKPFVRSVEPKAEALKELSDQPYKSEIIEGLGDQEISFYQHGGFKDLCEGPHVDTTAGIGAFKLTSIAGAYWRGDEHRPMLQRIYGACFSTQAELDQYLNNLEEAQKRDHRRLGKDLDLFSFHEEYGPGLVYWHPKGGRVRTIIEDFWRQEHYRAGYDIVFTPHIGRATLWETSGHLNFYNENMYSPMEVDDNDYYIKPMNCPFHIQIYKNQIHSYRELPLRLAELGTVYRYERSGVLHGLVRVRGFTQDDAHIFCRPDQVEAEVARTLEFVLFVLRTFGFKEFAVAVATKPEKSVGADADWRMATDALRRAVSSAGLDYDIDEGGGAFYGPKIDLHIKDALGRAWQCSTIQFDFNLPERFDVSYVGEDGQQHRPYMVHRALLGSMERFFGVLIEHYGGAFPLWLAPVQAKVIPIADRHVDYCLKIADELRAEGIRVEVDSRTERMQAKIRDAQLQKVPYMLIAGDRDVEANAVSVRTRSGDDLGAMPLFQVIDRLKDEVVTGMNPEEAIA
ncbi:MAG TPA: threonine--tRNA ligase [Dehalococcoidia bacterium]